MAIQITELTRELAARLLANPHPKQRRIWRSTVAKYAETNRAGGWRLVPDPILVDGATGQMFNGGHRCQMVVETGITIPVYIDWEADASIFDVIDGSRPRSAYQFITTAEATAKASATRVVLWYEHRFDRPCDATGLRFDMHQVLLRSGEMEETYDRVLSDARATYSYTGLAKSVCLAVYAIADEAGIDVSTFVAGVVDPSGLAQNDARRVLANRFRQRANRQRRRDQIEDFTVLVRALNLFHEGRPTSRLVYGRWWPRVGETEADFVKRSNANDQRRSQGEGGAS